MPYTGSAFFDKSRTIIGTAYTKAEAADSSILYSIVYAADGSHDAATMEERLKRFRSGITVNER
jgi:hypothetical protein